MSRSFSLIGKGGLVTGTAISEVTIAGRFNGPDGSANGGYASGLLAGHLDSRATVALHAPPPLDVPLQVTAEQGRAHLWCGEDLLASAAPGTGPIAWPAAVPVHTAVAALNYHGWHEHPFPSCFVCGVRRRTGDGLGLTPGDVPGRPGSVACAWTPDESVADEGADGAVASAVVWSVLDCPGGWAGGPMSTPRVLVWMTAAILEPVVIGTRYVVVGEFSGRTGPSFGATTALYGADGRMVAHAASRWLVLA